MACKNKVITIGGRYGEKTIKLPCGSTSVDGDTLLCDKCEKKYKRMYPQGWISHPGDLCKHGVYIGDIGGRDILCGMCELGY